MININYIQKLKWYGTFDKYSKNNPLFDPYRLENENQMKREDAEGRNR